MCVCVCVCVSVPTSLYSSSYNTHTFHSSFLPLINFQILLTLKALALTKMRCPSDRQEFLSALAEWTKHVYGENPNFAEENVHPVATAATLHLQQLMKDKVVENLARDNSGAVQDSLPQGSEITDDTVSCWHVAILHFACSCVLFYM